MKYFESPAVSDSPKSCDWRGAGPRDVTLYAPGCHLSTKQGRNRADLARVWRGSHEVNVDEKKSFEGAYGWYVRNFYWPTQAQSNG